MGAGPRPTIRRRGVSGSTNPPVNSRGNIPQIEPPHTSGNDPARPGKTNPGPNLANTHCEVIGEISRLDPIRFT
jgi:hypothetical protein